MIRYLVALMIALTACSAAQADAFDRYTNAILSKVPGAEGVKEIPRLTPQLVSENAKLIPNSAAAFVVMRTNGGVNSRLLVQFARQKTEAGTLPITLIDRFVTYKATDALQASGANLHLYKSFQLNLDLGQIVPDEVGGDLRLGMEGDQPFLEPIGKAKMYLLTKNLPGTEVKKTSRPEVGQAFEPRFFNGTYRLFDDGRRVAKVTLKVGTDGGVSGEYVSEQSGRNYEVYGKILTPKHLIQFTVKFPQSEQVFQGWMFTQGGAAIAGSTKLQEREFGFYAIRLDDE